MLYNDKLKKKNSNNNNNENYEKLPNISTSYLFGLPAGGRTLFLTMLGKNKNWSGIFYNNFLNNYIL